MGSDSILVTAANELVDNKLSKEEYAEALNGRLDGRLQVSSARHSN